MGGLEMSEQRVKAVSADRREKIMKKRRSPRSVAALSQRRIPINDLSAVCQGNSLSVLIGRNMI